MKTSFLIVAFMCLVQGVVAQPLQSINWVKFNLPEAAISFEYPDHFSLKSTNLDFGNCAGSMQLLHAFQSELEAYDDPNLGTEKIIVDHTTEYEIIITSDNGDDDYSGTHVARKDGVWFLRSPDGMVAMNKFNFEAWDSYQAIATFSYSSGAEREVLLAEKELGSCKAIVLLQLYNHSASINQYNHILSSLILNN